MLRIKYRVHELAKDFGTTSKKISEILGNYAETPKNHMKVLEDDELSLVFECLINKHRKKTEEELYLPFNKSDDKSEGEKKDKAKKAEPKKAETSKSVRQEPGEGQPRAKIVRRAEDMKPVAPAKASKQSTAPTRRTPERRVVDMRQTAYNPQKYDEKYDRLAGKGGEGARRSTRRQRGNQKNQVMNEAQKRLAEQNKKQRKQLELAKQQQHTVMIPDFINVGELASRMKKTGSEVVRTLIKGGIMASLSDMIDFDAAEFVASELGCLVEKEVIVTKEEILIDQTDDEEKDLKPRAPVVVVMGHVDHGKTSLLDRIRKANVAAGEAGGITQHIGAYTVRVGDNKITFLDTPGHEAFTSMRARGAGITDIAILVVAANDGVKPQTVESISHAKAADIPIVVAVNKIDIPGSNHDRVKQQLAERGLVSEEWGGDTIICNISAKTGEGIDELLENLVLVAEMEDLKANPDRLASGVVIEGKLDKGRGPLTTVLVQNGTLNHGDVIIAGTTVGKIRTMTNDKGKNIKSAGPSVPVEISGLSDVPEAGDSFYVVEDERMARELVEERKQEQRNKAAASSGKVTLDNLFAHIKGGEMKELAIIVKADVQGSVEAVTSSLEKLSNEEVNVKVVHGGVGAISESDIMLASATDAIIVGFNVRPNKLAKEQSERENVEIRTYRVIYDCINEIEAAMKGMLDPTYKEVIDGHLEVRKTYKVSRLGTICGCYVQEGKVTRGSSVRVLRDDIVIYEGELASLKRFKDDVKEVLAGYECGVQVEKFNDIREGDTIEVFSMKQVKE